MPTGKFLEQLCRIGCFCVGSDSNAAEAHASATTEMTTDPTHQPT